MRELLKNVIKYTAIVCAVCTVLFEAIPGLFIRLFGSDGELYMQFATRCLRIYLVLIIFTCVQKVCSIFLQSIGHAKQAAPLSIIRDVLLIVFSLIAPNSLGVTGIFWAAPIADVFAMAITAVVMLKVWKELSVLVQAKAAKEVQAAAPHIQPSHPGPIITIARRHGSAGKRIGKLLAKEMGIPCYYKEVTAMAAQESGLSKDFISHINQNSPDRMHELYLSTNVVQQAVAAQVRIIRRIAENGSCVIVGRAAGSSRCSAHLHPRSQGIPHPQGHGDVRRY